MTPERSLKLSPALVPVIVILAFGSTLCAGESGFTVPNPFFDQSKQNQQQQDETHNNFYYILASEVQNKGNGGAIKEYFSLGRALSFRMFSDEFRHEYGLLTDGRSGKTYLVREPSEARSVDELDCELDTTHSHKHLFPWQFIYDVRRSSQEDAAAANTSSSSNLNQVVAPPVGLLPELDGEVGNSTARRNKARKQKRRFKATIFGLGGVWLNMIWADVRSTEIDDRSRYYNLNNWVLKTEHVDLEMMFEKRSRKRGQELDQDMINKLQPVELHVNTKFRYSPTSPERRQFTRYLFKEFKQNIQEDQDDLLKSLVRQLDWCRRQTRSHRTFPNLMRAIATSRDRVYRLEYVTKRFNLLGSDELNGKFNGRHHRYMFPEELVSEVFSLKDDIQSLLYDPNFLESQETENEEHHRLDMFMSCYTERAEGRSARYAAQHYHRIVNANGLVHSCIKGEREPKPRFRLLSKALKFHTEREIQYDGHLHGLGALLLNALEMRRSSNLLPLQIQVPRDFTQQEHRSASVNVWQVVDERQQVRVLFFIERRDPKVERRQLELAESDRNELARLVRVDIRTLDHTLADTGASDDEGHNYLAVTQQLTDTDADLMIQYHVFEFAFELDEFEHDIYLEVPEECKITKPAEGDDIDLPDEEDQNDDLSDTANNYDKNYDADGDEGDDEDEANAKVNNDELEAEFQFESGLIEEDTPMPDFFDILADTTSYKFVSRIESDDSERPKSIWLVETMDLANERLNLKIFLTRHDLEHNMPTEEFLILYQSEIVFRLWNDAKDAGGQRRCTRTDDVTLQWMRLLSAHLIYYVVAPNSSHKKTHELDSEDLVDETNMLSSYGLGALWRRSNQMGMSEFRGTKRERLVLNDGKGDHQYKQLVWTYQELDMTFELTFLLRNDPNMSHEEHHIGSALRLHSVLIQNEHSAAAGGAGEQLNHFQPVRITVESFEMGGTELRDQLRRVPQECNDALIEASRMIELDHEVHPPGYEMVLGPEAKAYELKYSIYSNWNRVTSRGEQLGLVGPRNEQTISDVRESFDMATGKGRIVINELNPNMMLEIFIDNERKVYLAYSSQINKCLRLTHLAPTYGTLLSTMVFDNENFEPDKLHGLMGLWQALSQKPARLHVRQMVLPMGDTFEQQTYTLDVDEPAPPHDTPARPNQGRGREQVRLYFEKRRPVHYGAPPVFSPDKTPIRSPDVLALHMIEFKPVKREISQKKTEPITRIFINKLQKKVDAKWDLPHACEQALSKLDPSDSDSEPESIDSNHETPANKPLATPGQFPKLSDLFARSRRFEMRSEVSILGGLDKLRLVDEMYNEGDFRLRTRGLGVEAERNCDLLMFNDTHDQFDLSELLRCPQLHDLQSDSTSRCLSSSLYDVWLGHKHQTDDGHATTSNFRQFKSIANLHYGPLSLWRLAEQISVQEPENVKLISTIELSRASQSMSSEQFRQMLEREMDEEIWQVMNPTGDETICWSYLLRFVKYTSTGEPADEWHVLEEVTVNDCNEHREQFTVTADVVNYNWLPDKLQFEPLFRLPEGWNCKRKLLADGEDGRSRPRFKLSSNPNKQLAYEASLELFEGTEIDFGQDDLELGPLRMESHTKRELLPTQIGAFLTGGDLDGLLPAHWQDENNEMPKQPAPRFDMDLQQSVCRLVGGGSLARQLVTDRRAKVSYDLNMKTGACTIAPAPWPGWQLIFPDARNGSSSESLRLADDLRRLSEQDLFTKLFLADENDGGDWLFALLNKHSEEISLEDGTMMNVVHEIYEYEYPTLRLTPSLTGPARVVREFTSTELDGRLGSERSQPFVAVRVYLLSEDKLKLKAILSIRVQQVREASLSEFLTMAQVTECFNKGQPLSDRRQASLTLEYPMQSPMDELVARMHTNALRDQFYAMLLAQNRLWPSQIDGRARIEFTAHDNLLRVHFNVLEAPTSSVYFQTLYQCAISDTLISMAETRILPNQLACSRWCDQINCVAMSYCEDHQCNVLLERTFIKYATSNASIKSRRSQRFDPTKYSDDWQPLLYTCNPSNTCTYFYNRLWVKPRPLDAFRDFLDRTVNARSNKFALKELSLPLGYSQRFLEPTRFYESNEMFRWQHEDFSDPFEEILGSKVDTLTTSDNNNLTFGSNQFELADSFAVWQSGAQLPADATKLDQLNDKLKLSHASKFLMIWATAANRAGCLQECQRNRCLLVSTCGEAHRCAMIVASGTESVLKLDELREIMETQNSHECTISIRDHLEQFHLFENTQKPQKFSHQLEGYSREECAAACETLGSECLAFDLCNSSLMDVDLSDEDRKSSRACFLQETHVSQDAFDRSVLLPAWDRDTTTTEATSRNTLNGSRATCDHYSKSVLAGFFQRIPNVKLRELHQSELEGVSADKCAADCLQDDTCRGFEHCQNPKRAPTQSCYPIRSKEGADDVDTARLKDKLVLSRTCSIYMPKATLKSMRTEQAFAAGPSQSDANSSPYSGLLARFMTYLLVSVTVGAIIQLAYVKLANRRPIQLHGDRF